MTRTGMQGFDGGGFAVGSLTGVRWWTLDVHGDLKGSYGYWQPGENTAECKRWAGYGNRPHRVPDEDCACGFWAYWSEANSPLGSGSRQVLGVVEGYGDGTLIGSKGFRCAKARIVALHLAFQVMTEDRDAPRRVSGGPRFWRGPQGQAAFEALTGNGPYPVKEDLAAQAALELALGEKFGVPVYANKVYMLQRHPPTQDYVPQPAPYVVRLIEELRQQLADGDIAIREKVLAVIRLLAEGNITSGPAYQELERMLGQAAWAGGRPWPGDTAYVQPGGLPYIGVHPGSAGTSGGGGGGISQVAGGSGSSQGSPAGSSGGGGSTRPSSPTP